jgi:hypothetical protein
MSEQQWVRSHVERLLQDEWDVCRASPDADGDYPFRFGTAACWVTFTEDPVMVRVFAHAAEGVRSSYKLLRELNEMQARTLTASLIHDGSVVIVSQTISPVGLTRPVLAQAMQSVGGVADDIGLLLALMFDATTPYPIASDSDSDHIDEQRGSGEP